MATIELTLEKFPSTIEKEGIVLVDFWASWCGPCRQFGPIFERVSEEYTDVVFAKVDTDAQSELAGMAGISSIPTVMGFRDGIAVFRTSGAMPEAALKDVIGQIKDLDMEQVRSEIAAEEAKDSDK